MTKVKTTISVLISLVIVGLIFLGFYMYSFRSICTLLDCFSSIQIEIPKSFLLKDFSIRANDFEYNSCIDGFNETRISKTFYSKDNISSRIIISYSSNSKPISQLSLDMRHISDCSKDDYESVFNDKIILKNIKHEPNGPGCEPTCYQAFVNLTK